MAARVGLARLIQDNLRLLRQRQRLADDEPFVTLQVGKQVFEGAPRQMRVELWKSSLQRRGVGVAAAKSYEDLLQGEVGEEAGADIQKDLARTFPLTKRFAGAEGQAALRRVLRAYAALDPEVGYCQGMNFVAALLLTYLPEPDAFGALVVLMQDRGLRRYYSTDMALLQAHLWQLGRLMPQALCAHLEGCGVLPSLYAASWLMTCYSADFPASFSARIMDVILSEKMDQALLKVAVTLLGRCERKLRASDDLEDVLSFLKQELTGWDEASLHDALTDAFKSPWTPRQQALLSSLEGAETVSEAQRRVSAANTAAAAAAAGGGVSIDAGEEPGGGANGTCASGQATPRPGTAGGGSEGGGGLALLPPPASPTVKFSKSSGSLRSRNASSRGLGGSGGGGGSCGGSGPPSPAPALAAAVAAAGPPPPALAAGAGHAAAAAAAASSAAGSGGPAAAVAGAAAAVAHLHDLLGDWEPFPQHPPAQHPAVPPAQQPAPGLGAPVPAPAGAGAAAGARGPRALLLEDEPGPSQPQSHHHHHHHHHNQQQQQQQQRQEEEHHDAWGDFVSSPQVSSPGPAPASWGGAGSSGSGAAAGASGGGIPSNTSNGGGGGGHQWAAEHWQHAAALALAAPASAARAQQPAAACPPQHHQQQQQQPFDPFVGSPTLAAVPALPQPALVGAGGPAQPTGASGSGGGGGGTALASDPFGDWQH